MVEGVQMDVLELFQVGFGGDAIAQAREANVFTRWRPGCKRIGVVLAVLALWHSAPEAAGSSESSTRSGAAGVTSTPRLVQATTDRTLQKGLGAERLGAYDRAFSVYSRAMKTGSTTAQARLGYLLLRGQGCSADPLRGFKHLFAKVQS